MNLAQSPHDVSNLSPQSASSGHSPETRNTPEVNASTDRGSAAPVAPPTGEKRVSLACMRCRTKRARCSGEKPTCSACQKAGEECTWPAGRKRKRTRREMEEEERKEREAAAAAAAQASVSNNIGSQNNEFFYPVQRQSPHAQSTVSSTSTSYAGAQDRDNISSSSIIWVNTELPIHNAQHSSNMWNFPMPGSLMNLSYVWPGQPKSSTQSASPPTPVFQLPPQFSGAPDGKGTVQIARAIESQIAYIDGDPGRQEELELYYYRFSGSTAIHPGINRISLKLQPRVPQSTLSAPVATAQSRPGSPQPPEQLFDDSGLPLPHVYLPLLDTFFRTMAWHFPSISRKRMEERLETGTMSAFLLNCICAISARFHPMGGDSPTNECAPFITKAQELIIPLLHLPTTDVVTGLLLLAWANYGQNSDSGLWVRNSTGFRIYGPFLFFPSDISLFPQQFSGMAIRMALDLGLHEVSEIYETLAHVVRTRLLFWSLFITDRILAFSTGRSPSISEEIIEIPLPTDEDFFPDPARNNDPAALAEEVQPVPFQHLVRLFVLCGRIANVLNGRRGRTRTLVGPGLENGLEVLSELQAQLVQFYAELPEDMKWSVEAFKRQELRGHGGTYLTLHLWANAVMALVYHPGLLSRPDGSETPVSQSMDRSVKLALASSRTISECLVFADLFASQSYLRCPHVVQPIFVACLAFIQDIKIGTLGSAFREASPQSPLTQQSPLQHPEQRRVQETGRTAELLLTTMWKQNLRVLMKALRQMEHYWAGVSYVSATLEERARGLSGLDISQSPRARTKKTFISLPDKGLLKRFTNKDLPHNTNPPTETSLRASMVTEAAAATYPLDDLLSSYSVEGFYIQPANSFDLQSLMQSGGVDETSPGLG
ncbi:hypothetical protein L218DRAFT_1074512 [Marasmius fiardii PR-910]|nr:hypothetical protein L218DRAFT_1074512 [Marasmius fiardii PR-910]